MKREVKNDTEVEGMRGNFISVIQLRKFMFSNQMKINVTYSLI